MPLLRAAIARSIELRLIPMVELHDVTGSRAPADLLRMAEYYVGRRDLLEEFEEQLLVNIAK